MVFIDGSGAGTFAPLRTLHAAGAVGPWVSVPVAPLSGDRLGALHPTLDVLVSAATPPAAVQFDVSAVADFSTVLWSVTDTAVPNGAWSHIVTPALVDLSAYWWRTRAGDGAGTWGPWSAAQKFTVDLNAGRGYAEVFVNVGIERVTEDFAAVAVYLNQGVTLGPVPVDVLAMWENVHFEDLRASVAVDSMYLGDVNTATPSPHIWFLRPESGRAGDGISIVCAGVGDLAGTYSAVVEYLDAGAWHSVPVVTWQTFPGTPAALTAGRTIDAEAGVFDPQHTVIQIVVPAGALPPGYPVRVRTEGP